MGHPGHTPGHESTRPAHPNPSNTPTVHHPVICYSQPIIMTRTRHLCALLFLVATALPAQTPLDTSNAASPDYQPLPIDRGASALQQSLRKLNTRASLMMIVAHPDDEDGGMLTYESRGQGPA